ncbi:MAG: hypothetical protein J6U22_05155 [Bacteroidaceae bacterium]|nr:hypothetical protein [Bacteroidaceae bacterium]
MPKFHPTPIIQDCWSSIGNITFYHRNGQCFYKRKPYTVFRGTAAQLDQAQVHHRAILAWQHLPHSVQLQWNHYARSVPSHRPPYDNNHHISGYNLFVSVYHGFAQLGREHIPEPQPFPEFPSAALELLQIIPGSETTTLRCRLTLTDTVNPERWHLTAKIQLTAPGMGFNPGLMRTYRPTSMSPVSIGPTTSTRAVTFTVQQKSTQRGQNPLCAHIRYRLIDETTGYRNRSAFCS